MSAATGKSVNHTMDGEVMPPVGITAHPDDVIVTTGSQMALDLVVRVFCDIHSHMSAFILVFSHPYFSTTDPTGRYQIDNVPPGTYSVVAWNEGRASEPRSVSVPDGGSTELDLAVR